MRNPSTSSTTAAGGRATNGGTTSNSKTTPCCSKVGLKRGPWTPEEDEVLANYIKKEGEGRWRTLPKRAGLLRCGKSCRLRWMNYLRPCVKRGQIAPDEEDLILRLHRLLGNRQHQQLQHQLNGIIAPPQAGGSSDALISSAQAFGFSGTGWESALMSNTMPPAFNQINDPEKF